MQAAGNLNAIGMASAMTLMNQTLVGLSKKHIHVSFCRGWALGGPGWQVVSRVLGPGIWVLICQGAQVWHTVCHGVC